MQRTTLRHFIGLISLMAAATVGGQLSAQGAGEAEYMSACSTCHGAAAMGDGPLAKYMNVPVPSLINLTKENDGEFPMLRVIMVIDGRTGVRGHGSAMPVWGRQFTESVIDIQGPYGAETYVRGKVLTLAQYLESIQAE
jgi:mono/diheme cytochrome c family protein